MDGLKKAAIITLAVVAVIVGVYFSIQWDKTVRIWEKDADREVFKESTTYNEAAASFLADAYRDYNKAETDKDRETIMQYVVMRYPNLNYNNIDNQTLRDFYRTCIEH